MKKTVMQAMQTTVEKFGDKTALKFKVNGEWKETSWKDYYDQVQVAARAFIALGLEKGRGGYGKRGKWEQ